MPTVEILIEPKVLTWARVSIGKTIDDIAHHLKVDKNVIKQWESDKKPVRLTVLEKMANYYKRPLAAFFLPEPPKEVSLPKDYRTLPMDERKGFSSKTLLALRRAERVRQLAIELSKQTDKKINTNIISATAGENIELLAERVRQRLGLDLETQFKWKNEQIAFEEWRSLLEKNSILVMQASVPMEDTRGFSIAEDIYPTICVNSKDSVNGKIFSLFHEYAHLMLKISGICDMAERYYISDEDDRIETFCNYFAGAFLVPQKSLLEHTLIRHIKNITIEDDVLQIVSAEYKVSAEVILRRLVIAGKMTDEFYKKKKEEWDNKYKEFRGKKTIRRRVPARSCITENGRPFVSIVLSNYNAEKISLSDVSDYLGIRVKHLPGVEKLLYGRAD